MSINWVMLDERKGFVRLPGEETIYKSPNRTSLAITTPRTYPGNSPLSIQSSTGTVYLTNQRVVYLPSTQTKDLQSFSAPLLNLHDTHVTVPWFGANSWQAVLQPVPGGNIPVTHAKIEIKLVFNEGGAADFHSTFERIKERLQQAIEAVRASGTVRGAGSLNGLNLDAVHLDQLPSYEASGHDPVAPIPNANTFQEPPVTLPSANDVPPTVTAAVAPHQHSTENEPPNEAPPGYEEAQQQSIQQEFDRRFSNEG